MQAFLESIELSAAGWSAIAASFAAISSFLILRTQKLSLRESARPELILTGWSRESGAGNGNRPEKISFTAIQNIGRGTALHVHVNSFSLADDQRPTFVMSTIRSPTIAPNTDVKVEAEILIWWNNVPGPVRSKSLPVNIEIHCWDTIGFRHQTRYELLVVQTLDTMHVSDPIAPGIMLGTRTTSSSPVWRLKLSRNLKGIPVLGKLFSRIE